MRSQYVILLRYAFLRLRRELDAEEDGSKALRKALRKAQIFVRFFGTLCSPVESVVH